MIIDTHAHVWDLARASYPWLRPSMGALYGTFGYADLAAHLDDEQELRDCAHADHARAVLVQSADDPRDVSVMAAVAQEEPRVAGLVVWVPLDRPDDVAGEVERARAVAADAGTGVVGARTLLHRRREPDWVLRPETDAGLAELDALGLPYDFVTADAAGLEQLLIVAERHPGLRLVLDHLGRPPLGDPAGLARWRGLLAAVAEHPQIVAKLSGLYARGAPRAAYDEHVREVVDVALDVLGPDRLMVGSDWPMSLAAGGPVRVHGAVESALVRALDGDELEAVRGGTAARVYGLARVPT